MMGDSKPTVVTLLAVASLSLSGCASVPKFWSLLTGRTQTARLEVRPVKLDVALTSTTTPADRLFSRASKAIESRDYAEALDLLQAAKQEAPGDVRVLNAMAVVYDKLGRFDLSDRYYQLALGVDPQSPVVLANIRYSERLQTLAQHLRPEIVLAAGAFPAPPAAKTVAEPAAARLAGGVQIAEAPLRPTRVAPLLVGSSLIVVNATGRAGGAEPVRHLLASSGWTVRTEREVRPIQTRSQITFAAAHRSVAEALARTLPFEVTLVRCSVACPGIELVLGEGQTHRVKARA